MLRETAVLLVTLYVRSPPIAAEVRARPGAPLPSILSMITSCIMRNEGKGRGVPDIAACRIQEFRTRRCRLKIGEF